MDCCNVNGLDSLFRGPLVDSERVRFEKRGPNRRQQRLLAKVDVSPGSDVLDLGCGIGALGLTLLERGARHATFVDVSAAYLRTARHLTHKHNLLEQSDFLLGDAATLDLPDADVVTLDRVVCCYPDAARLLHAASAHSQRYLIFSYPRVNLLMKLGRAFLNGIMRLVGQEYRFFLHAPDTLYAAARQHGHTVQHETTAGVWRIVVFGRSAESG